MKKKQDDIRFEKMKKTLQSILDNHLPSDKQFSVKDFNKEQVWYVCRLLLEKDDEKRKIIWAEIHDRLKKSKYEFEEKICEISEKKELFDNYLSNLRELDDLCNDVEVDNEIDASLQNI